MTKKTIYIFLTVTVISLFFSYPAMLSYDIFNYIATAKVTFLYKENPYVIMPIELTGDPLLSFMHAANKIALYGPAWIGITAIPFSLGFNNFLITLFNFKALIVIFYILTLFLIYFLSRSKESVVLFAFHPLVLIEVLASGHNDIVMMGLALAAFFFMKKSNTWLAFFFLFLSILIKFATIFLLPVFIYLYLKKRKGDTIDWDQIYFFSFLLMGVIFLLSPIREEMYSWYAVWFLPFISLLPRKNLLHKVSLFFCYGLMLRYVPFMYFGLYTDTTKILRTLVTIIPVLMFLGYFFFKKRSGLLLKKNI